VQEGQLAPIDIVAAEAQITTFEQNVYSALEDVSKSENTLKNLVAENQQSPIWAQSLVPTDSVDLSIPQISLPEALKTATSAILRTRRNPRLISLGLIQWWDSPAR
jgi:HAE1 family hydrophobic/amphiphilic exporter-1